MKRFRSLLSFFKDAISIMFVGFSDTFELDLLEWDRRHALPSFRIGPREEHVGKVSADWKIGCDHEPACGAVVVTISGHKFTVVIPDGARICEACFERWLSRCATVCHTCGEPILPGMCVAEISSSADSPFTHMRPSCCNYPHEYCGLWGLGRLITLHELFPSEIPAGTRTIRDHALLLNPGGAWHEAWAGERKPG